MMAVFHLAITKNFALDHTSATVSVDVDDATEDVRKKFSEAMTLINSIDMLDGDKK